MCIYIYTYVTLYFSYIDYNCKRLWTLVSNHGFRSLYMYYNDMNHDCDIVMVSTGRGPKIAFG